MIYQTISYKLKLLILGKLILLKIVVCVIASFPKNIKKNFVNKKSTQKVNQGY